MGQEKTPDDSLLEPPEDLFGLASDRARDGGRSDGPAEMQVDDGDERLDYGCSDDEDANDKDERGGTVPPTPEIKAVELPRGEKLPRKVLNKKHGKLEGDIQLPSELTDRQKRLVKRIRELEIANEVAEVLDERRKDEITDLRNEKSRVERELGQMKQQLEDMKRELHDTEDDYQRTRKSFEECRDWAKQLEVQLDEYQGRDEGQGSFKRRRHETNGTRVHASGPDMSTRMGDDVEMGESSSEAVNANQNNGLSVTTKVAMGHGTAPLQDPAMISAAGERERQARQLVIDRQLQEMRRRPSNAPPRNEQRTMLVPPKPSEEERALSDERGFPMDVDLWRKQEMLVRSGGYHVYAHRSLYIWTYARAVPPELRTAVQAAVINEFAMTDWHSDLITKVAAARDVQEQIRKRITGVSRDTMPYEPNLLARMIQFHEWGGLVGCGFMDTEWTLDMRLVRGMALFDAITLGDRSNRTEARRMLRAPVDKAVIGMFCTPNQYRELLSQYGIIPDATFAPAHWPDEHADKVAPEVVARRLAQMGISVALIDDAFSHGRQWVEDWLKKDHPTGWTTDELIALLEVAEGITPPSGIRPRAQDLLPRDPDLPWIHRPDNIIQYRVADWQHPEMEGLRRMEGSKIQEVINRGLTRRAPINTHIVAMNNPYTTPIIPATLDNQYLEHQGAAEYKRGRGGPKRRGGRAGMGAPMMGRVPPVVPGRTPLSSTPLAFPIVDQPAPSSSPFPAPLSPAGQMPLASSGTPLPTISFGSVTFPAHDAFTDTLDSSVWGNMNPHPDDAQRVLQDLMNDDRMDGAPTHLEI
ncbi:hypothetical protein B0H15DRAFT_946273 [Mycena belliarum]|uniref:Uncharacterized protein n=1 Tax=Mycena belliarum TaxID=1033014 RepID=A0AAD6XQC5_9AGAR|nr:hypothetical protein B0H15DRAFT_946273 [Mycena belliae]